MGVPSGSSTRGEVNARGGKSRGLGRRGDGVDVHVAGEPLVRTGRRLKGVPGDLHRAPPLSPFNRDAEVLALAFDRVHLAIELADPDDAVEERGVVVVVE